MKTLTKFLSATAYFFRTIPPWHKFTGPTRRGSYDSQPRTGFDYYAKIHDIAFRDKGASQVYFGAFKSAEQSRTNIVVDWLFFSKLFCGIISGEYFRQQWKCCSFYDFGDRLLTVFDFCIQTIFDTLLVPAAIIILGINIGLNYLNIKMEANRQ